MGRVVVAGGAGFLGSHMCEHLLERGDQVLCVDNLITGDAANVAHLGEHPRFTFVDHDVTTPLEIEGAVNTVLHMASPASPVDYARLPLETLRVGTHGTENLLDLAVAKRARFLITSTSEVYGDPAVHPQTEDYWGNVNPNGPRSVYDEAKRVSEAFVYAYERVHRLEIRVARIFNTYGPRMRKHDGRAVPAFMTEALAGRPMPVFGDGSQTRSLCYVDDQIRGLIALLESDYTRPVNVGNPHEVTMLELAEAVGRTHDGDWSIEHHPLPEDDPRRRCPDITVARRELGWEPRVGLEEGLARTMAWWRETDTIAVPW